MASALGKAIGLTAMNNILTRLQDISVSRRATPQNPWGVLPGYYGGSSPAWANGQRETIMRIMNDGASDKKGMEYWTKFDRFYTLDLSHELPSGRHYIFMCRPDLYLTEEFQQSSGGNIKLAKASRVNTDPYFIYLSNMHPEIIASLTGDFAGFGSMSLNTTNQAAAAGSGYGNSSKTDGTTVRSSDGASVSLTMHTFIPYITTRIESLQLPDYTVKQNALVQPFTKYTVPYATSALESVTGGSFDLTMREDRYFSLHKLFYAWCYYEDGVTRNIFSPKDKYIMYNALDYATNIYDFIVDDTGENIVYWGKYTGCFPTAVPMSDLSFNRNSGAEQKISIPFTYFLYEHMDMNILFDFQYNSLGYIAMRGAFKGRELEPVPLSSTIPIYDNSEGGFLGTTFVKRPVIIKCRANDGEMALKLRWL